MLGILIEDIGLFKSKEQLHVVIFDDMELLHP